MARAHTEAMRGRAGRPMSELKALIWRFIERYPGRTSPEIAASICAVMPEVKAHRVPEYLFSMRAQGQLRRSDEERQGRFSAWYVRNMPDGLDSTPTRPVPELLAEPGVDINDKRIERQENRRAEPQCYAEILRRASAHAGAVVPARQVPQDQPWTTPYLRSLPGMRAGADDYRRWPSRRGSQLVHCYAKDGKA